MALSMHPNKALQQVNIGLAVLYGSGYFTEEEWIQIDGLVHKGQYEFTNGPKVNQDLLNFDHCDNFADGPRLAIADRAAGSFTSASRAKVADHAESRALSKPLAASLEPAPTPKRHLGSNLIPTSPEFQSGAGTTSRATANPRDVSPKGMSSMSGASTKKLSTGYTHQQLEEARQLARSHRKFTTDWANEVIEAAEQEAAATTSTDTASRLVGTVQMCRRNDPGRIKGYLAVSAGDEIEIREQHCEGVYIGLNRKTRKSGLLSDVVFKLDGSLPPTPSADHSDTSSLNILSEGNLVGVAENISVKSWGQAPLRPTHPRVSADVMKMLDAREMINAASWEDDEEDDLLGRAGVSNGSALGDNSLLLKSDFAPDASTVAQGGEKRGEITDAMRDGFGRVVDEKFKQIYNKATGSIASDANPSPVYSASRARQRRNRLNEKKPPVVPRTIVCWHWITPGSICRYTDDECRDLHCLPPNDEPYEVSERMSRAPLRDYLLDDDVMPPPGPLDPCIKLKGSPTSEVPLPDPKGRTLTCRFWADGYCHHPEDQCLYLHSHVGTTGIANRPYKKPRSAPRQISWTKERDDVGAQDIGNVGEASTEEAPTKEEVKDEPAPYDPWDGEPLVHDLWNGPLQQETEKAGFTKSPSEGGSNGENGEAPWSKVILGKKKTPAKEDTPWW